MRLCNVTKSRWPMKTSMEQYRNTHAHAPHLTFVCLRVRCMVESHVYIINAIEIETRVLLLLNRRCKKICINQKSGSSLIENHDISRCALINSFHRFHLNAIDMLKPFHIQNVQKIDISALPEAPHSSKGSTRGAFRMET